MTNQREEEQESINPGKVLRIPITIMQNKQNSRNGRVFYKKNCSHSPQMAPQSVKIKRGN